MKIFITGASGIIVGAIASVLKDQHLFRALARIEGMASKVRSLGLNPVLVLLAINLAVGCANRSDQGSGVEAPAKALAPKSEPIDPFSGEPARLLGKWRSVKCQVSDDGKLPRPCDIFVEITEDSPGELSFIVSNWSYTDNFSVSYSENLIGSAVRYAAGRIGARGFDFEFDFVPEIRHLWKLSLILNSDDTASLFWRNTDWIGLSTSEYVATVKR